MSRQQDAWKTSNLLIHIQVDIVYPFPINELKFLYKWFPSDGRRNVDKLLSGTFRLIMYQHKGTETK